MIGFTVPMKINSEKKHSVRYDAIGIDPGVTSIYVMKTSLPEKIPKIITIKVEMEGE
jgi:hypothetical protein